MTDDERNEWIEGWLSEIADCVEWPENVGGFDNDRCRGSLRAFANECFEKAADAVDETDRDEYADDGMVSVGDAVASVRALKFKEDH